MNTAIFWRLVWKEYRQQRALWTAIALAGLIFQVAVLIYCSLNGVSDLSDKLFTVALSVPVLYSLGCGAALFAGEHEAETFPFQQSLPVSAGRVFFAKFAFAMLSALLLLPVLWVLALAMASWTLPDALLHLQLWAGGAFATIEVLIWAVLGSLVLRRVLPAALAGGVTAALLGSSSLALMSAFGDLFPRETNEYFRTLPLRTCFALLALGIAVKFGRQWFNERPIRWASTAMRRATSNAATQRRTTPATWVTVFVRLVWHEWRQGRATMLWCVFGHVVLGTWLALSAQVRTQAYLGVLPALAAIFGASVFAADQRRGQYQFFTEHGVRPRLVWLSRQVVWGAPLIVLAMCAAVLQTFERRLAFDDIRATNVDLIGLCVLMFASGQLCSILIRSGIVAVFTAAMFSTLLFFWTALMASLGLPWILSVLPLPLICFGASWLYAPKWIQQRQTWRVCIVTTATIIVPLVGMLAATAAYRVYEIPAIVPSFDTSIVQSPVSPAARKTAEMYTEASAFFWNKVTTDADGDYTIASRDALWQRNIDLFIAASRRNECRFPSSGDPMYTVPHLNEGIHAVIGEARQLNAEGKRDASAELYESLLRYAAQLYEQPSAMFYANAGLAVEGAVWNELPAWAAHPDHNHERILKMLTGIQAFDVQNSPNWRLGLVEQKLLLKRAIALDNAALRDVGFEGSGLVAITTLGVLLPWERARESRLLDIVTETNLQGIEQLRAKRPRFAPYMQRGLPWDVTLTLQNGERRLLRSTDVTKWEMRFSLLPHGLKVAPMYVDMEQTQQAGRSAVQTRLALIAWRKQHEQLPESLDKLIDHPFDVLPLDSYTDQPFVYLPNGVEEEVWDDAAMGMGGMMGGAGAMSPMPGEGMEPSKPRLVRSEPFLWSPGDRLRYDPGSSHGRDESPTASDFRDQQGNTLSEQSLLHQGVRYPIPQAKQQPPDSADDADALPNDE